MTGSPTPLFGKLRRDARGSIAVEFALVAPVLMIVLAGVIDIGSAAYARLSLDARITTAADYGVMQPAPADQDAANAMADRLVGLLSDGAAETVEVNVNNAARATWANGSLSTSAGPGAPAACYCPTVSGGSMSWGAATGCTASCPSGDTAGPFVRISAESRHVSIFPEYGFVDGDTVSARAILRLN